MIILYVNYGCSLTNRAQIIWMSCATNVVVAGLSSRQLRELMPAYFEIPACSGSVEASNASVSALPTTWSVTLMVVRLYTLRSANKERSHTECNNLN